MFKLCLNQWTVGGFDNSVPVLECAKKVKEMGFDAIELCFGAGDLTPETSAEDLSRFEEGIANLGLGLSSLATGHYWTQSLSSPDETEREAAIAFTEAYLRAGQRLGVDAVLVVPGAVCVPWDDSKPVVPARQAWDLASDSLSELLPLAEDLGVSICVENVWNRFLTGPFEYASFVDSFDSPYLQAYFDVGNVILFGYPDHWIEILGDRIGRVHVKNFSRDNGAGTLDGFTDSLLKGDVDWQRTFDALKDVGYDGYVTAEMLISDKGLPDDELAEKVHGEMRELVERFG